MAWPGGGNPIKTWSKMDKRLDAIYKEDEELPIRKCHENPYVAELYKEFLGQHNGHLSHELLHTGYISRMQ